MTARIAVVGLWHLGCSLAASWLRLDKQITAVEFDGRVVSGLREGRAPLFEPGVDEVFAEGLRSRALTVTDRPEDVQGCEFVFVAYDTPVREDDTSDLT